MHYTPQLTNDQFVHEIYYRQSSIDVGQLFFFHSQQLENDDGVCSILMCNEQYQYVSPLELLCIINRTFDGILNLL